MFVSSLNHKKLCLVFWISCICFHYLYKCQSFLNHLGLGWTQLLLPAASPFRLITHNAKSLISFPPCFQNHPGDNMSLLHSLFWRLFLYPPIHCQNGASVPWGFIAKLAEQPQLHQDTNVTVFTFLVSPTPLHLWIPFPVLLPLRWENKHQNEWGLTVISLTVFSKLHSTPPFPAVT